MLQKEIAHGGKPEKLAAAREDLLAAAKLEPRNPRLRTALGQIEASMARNSGYITVSTGNSQTTSTTSWAAQRAAWLGSAVPGAARDALELGRSDLESLRGTLVAEVVPFPAHAAHATL